MVLALVRRPTIAQMTTAQGGGSVSTLLWAFLVTSGKIAGFIVFVLIFGRRMIPALLHWVAHTGSRELFLLAVLAIALVVALGAPQLFNVSFALGAFFAGLTLDATRLSPRSPQPNPT